MPGNFIQYNSKPLSPGDISATDLIDMSKVAEEAALISSITNGTSAVFLMSGEIPEPMNSVVSRVFSKSDLCARLLSLPNSKCLQAHKDAAAESMSTGQTVKRGCACGVGQIHSIPIGLTYRGRFYSKAAINILFLDTIPNKNIIASVSPGHNDDILQMCEGMEPHILSPEMQKKIAETVSRIADHLCNELTNAYDVYRATEMLRKTESELSVEKQKLEQIVRSVGAAFLIYDEQLRITWMNDFAERWFGPKDQIVGKTNVSLGKEIDDTIQQLSQAAFNSSEMHADLCLVAADDGSYRYYQIFVYPLLEDSVVDQVLVRIQDVTYEIQARKRLETYRKLFDNVDDFVFLADDRGKRLVVNQKVKDELGYADEELVGEQSLSIHPLEDQEIARRLRQEAMSNGSSKGEIRLVSKDGKVFETELRLTFSEEDRTFQGIYRDVSENRRMERELREKSAELEITNQQILAATKDKERFFANVSHELRTPMTTIIGFTELLLEDVENPVNLEQQAQLEKISRNAKKMLTLINDLLNLSRFEAGKMTADLGLVDLSDLITQVVDNMKPLVHKKPIKLIISLEDNLPKLLTDEQKLNHVLVNLISNAIKYTNEGSVTVSAKVDGPNVRIAVSDTGIGIDADDLANIFREFSQARTATKMKRSGSGLGLAIADKTIRFLGGEIQVESTPGKGSIFTVILPVNQEKSPKLGNAGKRDKGSNRGNGNRRN